MKKLSIIVFGTGLIFFAACKKDSNESPLKNEFIKRTVSPLIVGERIEFAYGAGSVAGKLQDMQVIASIPGATGTMLETVTHRTVNAADLVTTVATNSVTNGGTSSATIIDTSATTLRYIYVIPEEARGRQLSFTFSVKDKSGNSASTSTPTYTISKMSMVKNITMVGSAMGSRYFSIDLMRSFTQAQVDSGNLSSKIDFIYAYAATITPGATAYTYGHSFISPASSATYFPGGLTLPAAWTKNNTMMEKKIGTTVYDGQLKGDVNSNIYVDDLDLQKQTFDGSSNYSLGLTGDGSVFMKTSDGRYTAFVYVNSVTNASNTAVVSMKRYTN